MTVDAYSVEKTISATFSQEEQIDQVIRRLLDRGVPQDYISAMGKNFQSQTRIAGFISKKDVILGGLRTGGLFGSLFGTVLALLTGVGALWIPFVGWVVSAGPLGAALLGAAGGAIAGGAGAGAASALATLGMPEDKAAVYQTRLQAGEFLVLVEVPADKSGEIKLLLESAGGEEVAVTDMTLPRPCAGECSGPEDLAPEVRTHLSKPAQHTFIKRYNAVLSETDSDTQAEQAAWHAVHEAYEEDESGTWAKPKVTA